MNLSTSIYQDMAARTGGSIYIGVVGPVRTGKSTFIKRFMETQVLPYIDNAYRRDRAQDELPQSGSGRTVMTAERPAGGRCGLFRAAHRLRGVHGPRGCGPVRGPVAPHGHDALV